MSVTLAMVQQVIAEQLDIQLEQVKPESRIQADLGADSLEKVEIVIEFEDQFNIIIHDKDANQIITVQDAANAIDALIGCKV